MFETIGICGCILGYVALGHFAEWLRVATGSDDSCWPW